MLKYKRKKTSFDPLQTNFVVINKVHHSFHLFCPYFLKWASILMIVLLFKGVRIRFQFYNTVWTNQSSLNRKRNVSFSSINQFIAYYYKDFTQTRNSMPIVNQINKQWLLYKIRLGLESIRNLWAVLFTIRLVSFVIVL